MRCPLERLDPGHAVVDAVRKLGELRSGGRGGYRKQALDGAHGVDVDRSGFLHLDGQGSRPIIELAAESRAFEGRRIGDEYDGEREGDTQSDGNGQPPLPPILTRMREPGQHERGKNEDTHRVARPPCGPAEGRTGGEDAAGDVERGYTDRRVDEAADHSAEGQQARNACGLTEIVRPADEPFHEE